MTPPKGATHLPQLPPEAPLAMPVQDLFGNPPARIEVLTRPHGMGMKRLLLVLLTAVLSLAASSELRVQFSLDGLDWFEVALLICFVPLFSWVAFGFVTSLIGFVQLISGEHPGFTEIPSPAKALRHRTAVLMPVYNESVAEVFARVEAMGHSIAASGGGPWIDFFVLSDSRPDHGALEEEAWARLAPRLPIRLFYRRRAENTERKPGNIAEWVRRFGGAYENMLVLDADSLMSGHAIVGMAAIMEERPSVGLLQTVPMITNARTLFQRWMQFASEAYGPIASAGLLWWSGSEANFWGHNAIVRTRAFAEGCGLPQLPGNPPFGGPIQSHDMFESALLRRRGWAVHMIMIGGSYEEFPPSIVDFAIRDRRWMQGNLQHLQLLGASGLSLTHRLHLLLGASAYLTSPGWLLLVITSILRMGAAGEWQAAGGMPLNVLWLTLVLLFGPKVMGMLWLLADPARARTFGGGGSIVRSVALETVLSILLAPVTMVTQTKALAALLMGVPSGWNTQAREARRLPVRGLLGSLREHLLLGALFAATFFYSISLGLWLSPLALGLLLSPWLISLTSGEDLGSAAGHAGVFAVPRPEIADPTAPKE
ncbi:membrane glycosyltransferase [Novosphingobium sp. SG751A]|uniref:glucans biosynthesis glucosyltransferase MdoH n=1 Tax=Novosphingobium sp. SG751A TaxID=2587000 RepID=UPI001551C57B|nr:glucans biosynthesis glucosyltransferase MdoH [Novosphingobium sp. SG751A]NOW47883.1 membrane glycosyltransferase [Novosphingobium sp. SG751A]